MVAMLKIPSSILLLPIKKVFQSDSETLQSCVSSPLLYEKLPDGSIEHEQQQRALLLGDRHWDEPRTIDIKDILQLSDPSIKSESSIQSIDGLHVEDLC